MRSPNAVDFWRGFALVNILVSHIPDNGFWRFTLRQFSWSDGAEILVFLSGWVLAARLASPAPDPFNNLIPRLAKIYVAHVLVTFVVIFLYLKAQAHGDLRILSDNGVDVAILADNELVGGVILLMQHVRFFDILPLYFILTLLMPVMILLARASTLALFSFSVAYYLLAQSGLGVSQWPSGRPFAFNPFAWQLMFVIGMIAGNSKARLAQAIMRAPLVLPAAILIVLFALACMRLGVPLSHADQRTGLENSLWDKGNLGIMRIVQFVALAVVAYWVSPSVARLFPAAWRVLSLLGRSSLVVFSAVGVLSAIGQIAHRQGYHGVAFDTVFTAAAISMMLACAWTREQMKIGAAAASMGVAGTAAR